MLGYIEWDDNVKATRLSRRTVLGGTFLALHVRRKGVFAAHRAEYAARQLRAQGVRRAVFPVDFPYTTIFLRQGVMPIDPLPLRRALCVDFVRSRLAQREILPTQAVVAVSGEHLTPEMAETVKSLALSYRYVLLAVPEGEPLATTLRREYGIALLLKPTPDQLERADALLLFAPRSDLSGSNPVFCALYPSGEYGSIPLALDDLPPQCSREQLAAALYAMGVRRADTFLAQESE